MGPLAPIPPSGYSCGVATMWQVTLVPPQLRDSNFGCVCGGLGSPSVGLELPANRPPAHLALCVFHTETLCGFYIAKIKKCASQARNADPPLPGQNLHETGRHKRSRGIRTGVLHRISPRIFLEGSRPLNLNFFNTKNPGTFP